MTDVIEIKNRINVRNLIIFFILGIVGITNGARDFSIYKLDISKMLFPDPTVYHNVVVLNNTMLASSISSSSSFLAMGALILFIMAAVIVIGATAGVMGMGD